MSHHGTTVIPKHEEAIIIRVMVNFREIRGDDNYAERAAAISALPYKEWRGKVVHQIRCHGTRGKGPHDVWVAQSLLWNLISLDAYRCVYHAGD